MVTMKGFSTLLFLFLHFRPFLADAPAVDIPVTQTAAILMPMKAGKSTSAAGDFSGFKGTEMKFCGGQTIGSTTGANPFNFAYTATAQFELAIDCQPHPSRVIVPGTDAVRDRDATSFKVEEPTGTQTCSAAVYKPAAIYKDQKKETTVPIPAAPDSDFPTLCPSGSNLLYTNEDGVKSADYGVPEVSANAKDMASVPRWLAAGTERFHILRPFTNELKGKIRKPEVIQWTNHFLKLTDSKEAASNYKECSGTCDRGTIVKMTMFPGAWTITVYLNGNAEGFKMCIDPDGHAQLGAELKCKRNYEIFVLPQQGVVVWPGDGQASFLRMKSPGFSNTKVFAVTIGYGITEYKSSSGEVSAEFYVANTNREFVTSESGLKLNADSASRIALFFVKDDDLQTKAGIVGANIQHAFTYTTNPNGLENQIPIGQAAGPRTDGNSTAEGDPTPILLTAPLKTTTPPPDIIGVLPGNGLLNMGDNASDALYTAGKWWTWGILIGFVIGDLLGSAIIGGIFYVLRRTVYGFWYRGMFKRYGCDASGTTGGITGIGFGNTTTGTMTVGTAGITGGTTGGTTVGSTTGGTTSSDTTTGATKTSGSTSTGGSTMAM